MSRIDQLKAEAAALETEEKNAGRPLKHSAALEIIARKYGYENWRACVALLADATIDDNRQEKSAAEAVALKRYRNKQWDFELSIPARWNEFPPVLNNSPYEIARFASNEDGAHLMIVFRLPGDPAGGLVAMTQRVQSALMKAGFGNFKMGATHFGKRSIATLDFDRPQDGGLWTGREYFIPHGTLAYVLGCGTTQGIAMINLYDRIAQTFEPPEKDQS